MDSRLVPLLLVVLLTVPAPPAAAQDARPSLEMPAPLRDQHRTWMDDAFDDANETLRQLDLNATERRAIEGTMQRVRDVYEQGRHQALLTNLVRLRVLTRFFEIEAEGERQNATKPVFLNETMEAYQAAGNASEALRDDINQTQREVDQARALEVLYLAASTKIQGDNLRRLYTPTYPGILQAEGPAPPDRILQQAVQYSVGPRWILEYGGDLHDLAVSVNASGVGPGLNESLLPVARAFMSQQVADQQIPKDSSDRRRSGLERLRRQMNESAEAGNHVLSMAYGGTYLSTAITSAVSNQLEKGNLRRAQVRSVLRDSSGNLTPLRATLDAGYWAILQKDAHKLVDEALENRRVPNSTLARAVARLDTARTVGQALHPLAAEEESAGDPTPPEASPSTRNVLVAVGGGVALGAAAAVLGRRYLRN